VPTQRHKYCLLWPLNQVNAIPYYLINVDVRKSHKLENLAIDIMEMEQLTTVSSVLFNAPPWRHGTVYARVRAYANLYVPVPRPAGSAH